MSIFDPDNIEKALEFLPEKERGNVLDAVYCEIHNSWGMLKGNTADSDVEWFADWLYRSFHSMSYDRLSDEEKRYWNNLAETCLRGLPLIISRMEMRYEAYRYALHVLLKAEWAAKQNQKVSKPDDDEHQ